jgi:hypothetical protein
MLETSLAPLLPAAAPSLATSPGAASSVSGRHVKDDLRSIVDADGTEFRRVDVDQLTDRMIDEMVAVFRAAFGSWPLIDPGVPVLDHLCWKCSGPFTRIASLQALVDGRIAYATTSWVTWMRIDGRRFLRAIYPDTAVDPAFQGRRVYSRAVGHRRRLVDEPHDLAFHERMGSSRGKGPLARQGQTALANVVTRGYRVLRPLEFSAERGRFEMAPFVIPLAVWSATRAATRRNTLRRWNLCPRDDDRFDSRFDALFEEAAGDFDVICERTSDFLRWRYGDRRAGPFRVRTISGDGRLLGYAVLRWAGSKAYLADLLAVPGRLDVVETLVADAVDLALAARSTGIECFLSRHHPYRAALARQGVIDTRINVFVEYHPISASMEDLRPLSDSLARVHFQMGDTDLL